MECFSTAYLFYMGLQILIVSWTRLFFTAKVFLGGLRLRDSEQLSTKIYYIIKAGLVVLCCVSAGNKLKLLGE